MNKRTINGCNTSDCENTHFAVSDEDELCPECECISKEENHCSNCKCSD